MLEGPPEQCHSSLPWPPAADAADLQLRCALGTSRGAAQGPVGGCGTAKVADPAAFDMAGP